MNSKYIEPSTTSVSFSCPRCGAHAHQTWFEVSAKRVDENRTPGRPGAEELAWISTNRDMREEQRREAGAYVQRCLSGDVFFADKTDSHYTTELINLSVSECYSCRELSVWIHNGVVFPPLRYGVEPNADLPPDIVRDYEEARTVVNIIATWCGSATASCHSKDMRGSGRVWEKH